MLRCMIWVYVYRVMSIIGWDTAYSVQFGGQ
jgi:hypothetical protein